MVLLHTEMKADDKATGQQGLTSAVATRASYGQSTIMKWRMKAEIHAEFKVRNWLEENNEIAQYNDNVYRKHQQEQNHQ